MHIDAGGVGGWVGCGDAGCEGCRWMGEVGGGLPAVRLHRQIWRRWKAAGRVAAVQNGAGPSSRNALRTPSTQPLFSCPQPLHYSPPPPAACRDC